MLSVFDCLLKKQTYNTKMQTNNNPAPLSHVCSGSYKFNTDHLWPIAPVFVLNGHLNDIFYLLLY
jgi:hypothetical protein